MALKLKGVVATPVTPLTDDDELDTAALEQIIRFVLDSGCHALGVPMHTGESLNLTLDERKELAEVAVKTVAGQVPVLINVSLPGTKQVVELAKHAQRVGADGVVSVTPYHWQPGPEALFQHYTAVGSAIDIGLVAYNFPKKLGTSVSPELLGRLVQRLDNFVGLKDASYDTQYFTEACRITSELRPDFACFAGIEYMLPAMVLGGVGSFSPTGEVAPRLVSALYEACAAERYAEARQLQYRLSQLWNVLRHGYPSTIKSALRIMGRPVGSTRLPVMPLSEEAERRLEEQLRALGVLDEEPLGWLSPRGAAVG
jgi:4-hydroxy-tetrahydrodipicolinate synthase